jgi:queuosine precursor transporter
MIVAGYLAAVVAANLIVTAFGPGASVATAFFLIGFNVTGRDRLHDAWSGHGLRWKMAALVASGSLLSWLLNAGAGRIALASLCAFAVSETLDALVYAASERLGWFGRTNVSNVVSAAIDSVLFPTIAFGALLPGIVLGQFLAKTCGGALWAWVLRPKRLAVAALLLIAAPLHGQSLGVGVGEYRTAAFRQNVVEAVALGPSLAGFTPSIIASWEIDGSKEPVLIPQVGRDLLVRFPVILGADVGASAGPWDDYGHWELGVSARMLAFIAGGLKAVVIASWQPKNEWERGVVVKLDYTLWRR